jgi:hypothetical protein
MIESAEFSIDNRNKIKSFDLENDDFIRDLLSSFIENKSDWYPQIYSVNIPVVEQFRDKITKNLNQNQKNQDAFLFKEKFERRINQILEDKSSTRETKYPELDNYLKKLESQRQSADLLDYLKFVQKYAYETNDIDKKRLYDYYIENDAAVVPIKYWHETNIKSIPKENKWNIKDFLKEKSSWYVVIGAEFGVGKSSYSKYIVSKLADNYIYSKNEYPEYIPILVSLKNPDRVYNHYDFDAAIKIITNGDTTKKILCIYDGYDEYKDNHKNFFREKILNKNTADNYGKMKFIVTTRLESGYPTDLQLEKKEDTFVRLFPFQNDENNNGDGKKQTDSFFVKYGISIEYDTLKNYIDPHVLAKPLFCWMIAYTFQGDRDLLTRFGINNGNLNISFNPEVLNSTIIYLSCFHSIIKGRHKESLER